MFIKNLFLKIINGINILSQVKQPNRFNEHIKDNFKCSSNRSKKYITLLDTTQISRILSNRGLE